MSDQTIIPPARPQRPSTIRNLLPRLPERGHVKIGGLAEERKSAKGGTYRRPEKYDHFRVTTLERGPDGNFVMDKELHDKLGLGDDPTEIPIRLLYDDVDLSLQTRYAAYQGKTLFCAGDGVEASRASKEYGQPALPEPFKVQCPCYRQAPGYNGEGKCRINGRFSFLIDGASGIGGVYVLRTTSYNSVTGLSSSLMLLRAITGGILANIPLKLRLQPKQAVSPTDGSPLKIYVVSVEFDGDISELQQMGHRIALDRATAHVSIANIEEEARRLLALPMPENAILPGDDPEAIQEEFYPEASEEMLGATPPPRPTREQFEAKPGDPPHDPTTGEIIEQQPEPEPEIDPAEMLARSLAVAREGVEAFRAFWAKLSKPERGVINDDREKYQRIAEKADEARKAEAELVENVQDEPGSVEPDEVPESTWLVPIPKGKDGKSTDWPALRDALVSAADGCESLGDLTAFEETNAETIASMVAQVAVYANTVTSTIVACRQRFGAGGK